MIVPPVANQTTKLTLGLRGNQYGPRIAIAPHACFIPHLGNKVTGVNYSPLVIAGHCRLLPFRGLVLQNNKSLTRRIWFVYTKKDSQASYLFMRIVKF
ncbi:MAG: hypothetical protein A2534_00905 [Candidatus Magasanikbacteria bacterium RIFOXYD2_FULL_39_9]|uniref:Uncharacterized protein n=1 Tax=Candidatus Magasanikbacteria bacterium RIFOXYD1_FULL_40_23 TaxID=1798705 RepID=A0A1F6P7J7_9BACT|nr:MAG: hypothetical protein A2563_00995 [Candidatus Magasanikbacteria bacterium RIFOXYD1_FULL_40_23]OGH93544.1 MAG: hypothetical protein A2534_00905 [Candidatus Magasanikbacteria bacterium RIFOXYD2_FULL_39_9]